MFGNSKIDAVSHNYKSRSIFSNFLLLPRHPHIPFIFSCSVTTPFEFNKLGLFAQTHEKYHYPLRLISKALLVEVDRLQILLKNKLTTFETEKLENLLADSVGFYEITNLKREPRNFGFSEIIREIERGAKIKEIYQSAKEILPILEISNQSIAYYASLVSSYRVDKLKRFENWTTYLYLLCFIHQRYQRVQDNLINCLLYRIRLHTDQAKEFGKQKLSSIETSHIICQFRKTAV